MFSLDVMRVARDYIVAEIETDRCIVHEPYALEQIKALSDGDLRGMSNVSTSFSNITHLSAVKENGGVRPSCYIPWSDRLLVTAALIQNYDAIYHALQVEGKMINYDRPLPPKASDKYLLGDYRETYQSFRDRIIADENDGKFIIHADIRNFAGTVDVKDLSRVMENMGCDQQSTTLIERALLSWQEKGLQGVPQGYAMTDIFLKIIMKQTDDFMRGAYPEVDYYRYVDDIQLSSHNRDELEKAYGDLRTQLIDFGFELADNKTVFCRPGEKGICHSFDSKQCVENFKQACQQARWWAYPNGISNDDNVRHAFESFVYPGESDHPKYLVSHLIREKFALNDEDVLDVLPQLLLKYPSRTYKILKKAAKLNVDGRRPLNRLADMFFGDVSDASMDVQRLEYLKVLKDNDFPISEYDRRVIANNLPIFIARNPFACGYRSEDRLNFEVEADRSFSIPMSRP